jgi:ABC-type multidrug transport system permease subunit
LVARLEEESLLDLRPMEEDGLNKAVVDQEVAAGLTIPEGYGAALQEGSATAITITRTDVSSGAQSISEVVQSTLARLNAEMVATDTAVNQVSLLLERPVDAALRAQAAALVADALDDPAVAVKSEVSGSGKTRQAGGFNQASTGALVNWVLFGLLTISIGMTWERKHGLIRRLRVTGTKVSEIFGGKLLAMFIITFLQQLFLILLGQFAFGVDYFNSPLTLLLVMISLSALAASLGLLISSLFRSEQAVIATIIIAAQLLAALGGAWFPLEITSAGFARVAHFLPTPWLIDSLHGIVLKSWGIAEVLFPLGMVWVWIVVLFGLAVWRFRPE